MDVLTLRTELETLLVEYLGVYKLANGMTTPAVSVRSSGESLSAGTVVSGLELIILRDPALTPVPSYTERQAFREWDIFLIDWANSTKLSSAAGIVTWSFPDSTVSTVSVPEGLGPSAQMRITIRTTPDGNSSCGET